MVVVLFYIGHGYDCNAYHAGPETVVLAGTPFCSNYIFQGHEDHVNFLFFHSKSQSF